MDYIINEFDIKKAISDRLKKNGYNVVASEITEGFQKPAVFVSVLPSNVSLLNSSLEEVTMSIEIAYIPKEETYEHCILTAKALKNLLFYNTLDVGARRITISDIDFDIEKNYILKLSSYIVFDQATSFPEEDYDEMEELELGGNV